MNINTQIGIDWNQWLASPENKRLYEENQPEAMKKFRRDESEFIELMVNEQLMQEKIAQERK